MNTIGMFYADKIVYIFESASELIEIPRLPLKIDQSIFVKNPALFLQHFEGKAFEKKDFSGIPETLYDELNGEIHPSVWGQLSWNNVKSDVLGKSLTELPCLTYTDDFKKDFKETLDNSQKVRLQETLAKISVILQRTNGDTGELKKDGGLQYENFNNKNIDGSPIGHFRINQSLRVSCISKNEQLILRRYGAHDDVNNNP